MGNYFYSSKLKYLCDGILPENTDMLIIIRIHTDKQLEDDIKNKLSDYLQYTNPTIINITKRTLYMLYNQKNKVSFLRSNNIADIISYLSSELAIWITKNSDIDLRMVGVSIMIGDYNDLLIECNKFI